MTLVTLQLSERQRAVLRAVCDTLLPSIARSDDAHGYYATGALAAGTPARVERMFEQLANPGDQARLRMLLDLLDFAPANFVQGGGFRSFARMSPASRESMLRGWAHSPIALKRAGFQALKRLCHVGYFCWPVENGSHPAWRAVGYPGPLAQPPETIDPLPALAPDRDTRLDCDAVIVGSGAGGGVAAGILVEHGWDVVVLEKGVNPSSRDMTQVEGDMFSSLYLDRGMLMTHSGSLPILAGSCVGGGTVINWTTSFALPDAIRAEWDGLSGLRLFESERFTESLRRVQERLNVGTQWTSPGRRDELFEQGLRALGWEVGPIPRNVTNCREGLECGYCGYGCRHGAKNSTARTYLTAAAAAGARLVPHCDVERVLVEHGRAVGVEGTVQGANGHRHRMTVRADVVVVACGALYTPALLRRSGLSNANIGRNLHLHPVSATVGVFPDRVDPWGGTLQARYSSQIADMDGRGYGARFETGPIHFALPASAFGWGDPRQFRDDVGRLGHLSVVGILLRDRDTGRVAVTRGGRPRILYEVSRYDAAHMRRAIRAGAEVLAAAGATEVFSLQTPPTRIRPGGQGWLDAFTTAADATGYRRFRMSYISFHQMATAAMGCDARRGVIGETGETFEVRGLYVADASALPGSTGVNPMITIMAVSDHIARSIAARR